MRASNRVDTPGGRYYEVATASGSVRRLPSVTNILSIIAKPALVNWAAKVEREKVIEVSKQLYETVAGTPPMSGMAWVATMEKRLGDEKASARILKKAGEIGTTVHKNIEWTLYQELGRKMPAPPTLSDEDAAEAFRKWIDWKTQHHLVPIEIEKEVYSLADGYAGTLDLYGRIGDKTVVVDWKTGKAVYQEALLQNAAYQMALVSMGFPRPDMGLIVRLPKMRGQGFEVVEVAAADVDAHYAVFQKVRDLYVYMENAKEAKSAA